MSRNIQYKKLTDICEIITGEWGTEINENSKNIVSIIRTTNFVNNGKIDIQNKELVRREMDENKIEQKKLKKGDIIIEKSGGSPNQPVGRVVFFNLNSNEIFLCNNFTSILRIKENINSKYIFYFLRNSYKNNKVLKFQNKTTGIINLKLQNYLNRSYVYLPELKIQNKVVNILDILETILEKNQNYLNYLKELGKSLFTRMFGDIKSNDKNWKSLEIKEVSNILTRGKTPKYTSLSNIFVINQACIYWDKIKYENIKFHIEEENLLFLKNKDILINSTGTGTLGRMNIIKNIINEKFTVDSHVMLLRLKKEKASPVYFINIFMREEYQKELILKCVNGSTNQIELSKEKFSKLKIPVPPIELQNKFAERIEKIEKLKFTIWKIISKVYKILKKKGVESN